MRAVSLSLARPSPFAPVCLSVCLSYVAIWTRASRFVWFHSLVREEMSDPLVSVYHRHILFFACHQLGNGLLTQPRPFIMPRHFPSIFRLSSSSLQLPSLALYPITMTIKLFPRPQVGISLSQVDDEIKIKTDATS
jgi:hypothetical protein